MNREGVSGGDFDRKISFTVLGLQGRKGLVLGISIVPAYVVLFLSSLFLIFPHFPYCPS